MNPVRDRGRPRRGRASDLSHFAVSATAHPQQRMIGILFQRVIAAVVWIVANVVYLDMKRKGVRGFTRFAAFWAGTPTTWITFFAVREGTQPTFEAEVVDDDLLEEIRRDRALRSGTESDP